MELPLPTWLSGIMQHFSRNSPKFQCKLTDRNSAITSSIYAHTVEDGIVTLDDLTWVRDVMQYVDDMSDAKLVINYAKDIMLQEVYHGDDFKEFQIKYHIDVDRGDSSDICVLCQDEVVDSVVTMYTDMSYSTHNLCEKCFFTFVSHKRSAESSHFRQCMYTNRNDILRFVDLFLGR